MYRSPNAFAWSIYNIRNSSLFNCGQSNVDFFDLLKTKTALLNYVYRPFTIAVTFTGHEASKRPIRPRSHELFDIDIVYSTELPPMCEQ